MELVTPGLGLVFWMTIAFGVVLWVLAKFAWKPIMTSIHEREKSIDEALNQAKLAKEEMEKLKVNKEALLNEAKLERDQLLKETLRMQEKLMQEAKEKAAIESERTIEKTKKQLELERMAAMSDLKKQIGQLSLDIAEKLLSRELRDKEDQQQFLQKLVKEIKLN
jgi:F-type H+-transporting ATPase subunit b